MAKQKIEAIEGIGSAIGRKFRSAGIKDTDTLLEKSKTSQDRKKLAKASGLKESQILKFANMADLFRINGIGIQYAELLEAAGVDTVPELSQRKPGNLTKAMAEVNEKKDLVRRVPYEKEVIKWVEQAKSLPRIIQY